MARTLRFVLLAFLFCAWLGMSIAQADDNMAQGQELLDLQNLRTWDFGEIKAGAIVEHTFSLKNDTDDVMHIKNIDTSCGCTTSGVSKKAIESFEQADLTVKFNSKGYIGKVTQFVFVNTDSIDRPVIQFVIKAEVKK